MDKEMWQATVHAVTKSQTQQSNFTFSTLFLDSIMYALIYDICFPLSDLLHSA